MKNSILSVLILFGLQAFAAGTTWTVGITGMHCASCAKDLTKAISGLPSVAKCDVSLKEKQATIQVKEGQTLDKAALGKLITDEGFTMGAVKEKKEEPKGEKKS